MVEALKTEIPLTHRKPQGCGSGPWIRSFTVKHLQPHGCQCAPDLGLIKRGSFVNESSGKAPLPSMTALTHRRAHKWVDQTVGSQAKHLFNNNKLLKRLQSLIHVGTCPGIKIAHSGPPVIVRQRALGSSSQCHGYVTACNATKTTSMSN